MGKQSGRDTYVEFDGTDLSGTLRDFRVRKVQNGADMRVARFDRRGNYNKVVLADVVWEMSGDDVLYDEASDVW